MRPKLLIFIQTYDRPILFRQTLQSIIDADLSSFQKIRLVVYDDCSSQDYGDMMPMMNKFYHASYYRFNEHLGKEHYWQMIDDFYHLAKSIQSEWDYILHLPDDILLKPNAVENAFRIFNDIQDEKKVCFNPKRDERTRSWTNFTNVHQKTPMDESYYKVGWVDMLYLANKRYFEALDFTINPIVKDWKNDPYISSGVGAQISRRLYDEGFGLYQAFHSYVIVKEHESKMNPEERKRHPHLAR